MQQFIKYIFILLFTVCMVNTESFAQRKKGSKSKKQTAINKQTATKKKQKSKKSTQKKSTSKNRKVANAKTAKKNVTESIIENVEDEAGANETNMPPKEVVVTSAFKPSLRNAAKINFIAATPYLDTSKQPVKYFIPSQNLFFNYQPVAIKPLALPYDTVVVYNKNAYVKLGYGNFASPLAEAAISFGNGKKSMVQLFGKYYAANGNVAFQNVRQGQLKATTIHQLTNNHELNANLSFSSSQQFRYGIENFNAAAHTNQLLQQNYTAVNAFFLLSKKKPNNNGVTYSPSLAVNYFTSTKNNIANEVQLIAKAPFVKTFNKMYSLQVGANIHQTYYTAQQIASNINFTNGLYSVYGNIVFATPNFTINAGIAPTWDNKNFSFLPDITVTAKLDTKKDFAIIAGWKGSFIQNTLQSLVTTNPFISAPNFLMNTKQIEQYAGIKGTLTKHVTMLAKASLLKMNNVPLFANELSLVNNQNFQVLNESNLNILRISGEVGYTLQEKLWLLGSVTFNNFTKIETNSAAYGLLPLELNASGKWKLVKDVMVKADLLFLDGNNYRNTSLQKGKLDPALDVSAGVEFTAFPKTNLWLQFNNLFNNRYQRWNQYNVFGFQVQAGFVYSFK